MARAHAGNHVDRDARTYALVDLLAAAAEDESVSALESYDVPTGQRVADEVGVDLALLHPPAAGNLGRIDHERPRREFAENRHRGEPVGDDDVRARDRVTARDGEQARIAGPPADQRDPANPRVTVRGRGSPWLVDDAEHASVKSSGGNAAVRFLIASAREYQCGRIDVLIHDVALVDGDQPTVGEVGQIRRRCGGHHGHHRARVHQRPGGGDGPARGSHHGDPSTTYGQLDRQCVRGCVAVSGCSSRTGSHRHPLASVGFVLVARPTPTPHACGRRTCP